jgi:hypothetical protein
MSDPDRPGEPTMTPSGVKPTAPSTPQPANQDRPGEPKLTPYLKLKQQRWREWLTTMTERFTGRRQP